MVLGWIRIRKKKENIFRFKLIFKHVNNFIEIMEENHKWIFGIIGFITFLIILYVFVPPLFSFVLTILPYLILFTIAFISFYKVFVKVYGETERGIIYRMGRFHRVAGPGWSVVIPFFEREFQRVDIRTRTMNLREIGVVTRDDIPLTIDATFFYSIVDPKKAVLQVTVLEDTVKAFVYGVVRDGIGTFVMREVFYNIEEINDELKKRLTFATEKWGIDVSDVEIMKVQIPDRVLSALIEPVTAEQKAIASRFQAEARRVLIEVMGDAAERLNPNALTYLYLKALEKIAKSEGSKIVLPVNYPRILEGLVTGAGLGLGIDLSKEEQEKIISKITEKLSKG